MLDSRFPPPLSLVHLIGVTVPPGAERLLAPPITAAMYVIRRRHPAVFERLGEYGERRFLIDPTDLPFAFLLIPRPESPRLQMIGSTDSVDADVLVRGPLTALLTLLQGRVDGDSLFFSRQISVEGETAALLALRNAIDGEEIDLLRDFVAVLGPLAPLVERMAVNVGSTAGRLANRLASIVDALMAPLDRRTAAQAQTLAEIEARLLKIEHGLARRKA